jgi:hypothetical protein
MPQTAAPLVGLIGKKRVGKDSFASVLVQKFGYERVALADPLREAALGLDPIVGTFPLSVDAALVTREWRLSDVIDAIGWERAKDYVPEVRRTLQRLGTESVRALDEDFWIRIAFARIDKLRAAGIPVVVTDVRYENEAEAVRNKRGYLVRITRDLDDAKDAHASENALNSYAENVRVGNNGSLQDMEYLAESFARDLEFIYQAQGTLF